MDLTTTTSIAEIIASLGVIVALVFVARTLRRNARNTNLASAAKALEKPVHRFAHLADEPQRADLLRRPLDDPNLKTKPLNEELPWLFAIEGGTSTATPTDGDKNYESVVT